jgi:hypothetical protein
MNLIIYGLIDTRPGNHFGGIRYVGKSSSGLKRPKQHLSPGSSKEKTKLGRWLRSHVTKSLEPRIIVLEASIQTQSELNSAEIYWIGLLRLAGADLKNMSSGGEASRAGIRLTKKQRVAISKRQIGRTITKEHREKTSATLMGHTHTPETIDKISRTKLSQHRKNSEHQKEVARRTWTGRNHTDESKSKMRKPKSPEHIENARIARWGAKPPKES